MSSAQIAVWVTTFIGAGAFLLNAPDVTVGTLAYVAGVLLLTGLFSWTLAQERASTGGRAKNAAILMLCREKWRESQGADANAMHHLLPLPYAEVQKCFAARNEPVPDDWEIIVGSLPH